MIKFKKIKVKFQNFNTYSLLSQNLLLITKVYKLIHYRISKKIYRVFRIKLMIKILIKNN